MDTFISNSEAQTFEFGRQLAAQVRPGTVIALWGELGSGKSVLVRGLAAGLGITSKVHSPTFTLVNCYAGGKLPLFHIDLYRVDPERDWPDLGLDEYLPPRHGMTVVEWADKIYGPFPEAICGTARPPYPLVGIEITVLAPNTRKISHEHSCP